MLNESLQDFLNKNNMKFNLTYIFSVFIISYFSIKGKNIAHPKMEILFFMLILAIGLLLINFYSRNKEDIVKITAVTILIFGFLFVFTTPLLDAPDENYHLYRSELTSQGIISSPTIMDHPKTIEFINSKYELPRDKNRGNHPYGINIFKTKEDTDKINTKRVDTNFTFGYNSFTGYIPQAIGIKIAELLSLNIAWLIWLGRICNLLFYTAIASFAIKKTPRFKVPFALVAMLPMSVYMASSLSIDSSINALGLLAIAMFFKMYDSADNSITIKEILFFDVIVFLCAICKMPYIFLIFLLFLIPISKFINKKQYALITSTNIAGVLAIFYLYTAYISHTIKLPRIESILGLENRDNTNISANKGNTISFNNSKDADNPLYASNKKPLLSFETMKIVLKSAFLQLYDQYERLFTFGWLTYQSKLLTNISLVYYSIIGLIYPENINRSKKSRLFCLLIFSCIYLSTYAALYVGYTIYIDPNATVVSGVQGRYFIPLLALMPFMISLNKDKSFKDMDLWIFTFSLVFLAIPIMLTIFNYY